MPDIEDGEASVAGDAMAFVYAVLAPIFLLVGVVLLACAVALELTKSTFLGLLLGGFACLAASAFCCCFAVLG